MPSGFCGATAVLGIGVVFESNSRGTLKAALEILPKRSECEGGLLEAPVYIVLAADHGDCASPEEHRVCGKQLRIVSGGIKIDADGERGRANCAFCVDAIGTELFHEAIRTAALFLVAQRGRTPVHASAIMIGDRALVLAGRSGSGKSTLAFAAHSTGLPVLAEDTVFVQLYPAFRIWGLCDHIHLFEKDAPVNMKARTRLRSGRLKYAVPVAHAQQSAHKAALCVLASGDHVRLAPLSPDVAARKLTKELEPGYDFHGDRMEEAVQAIAAGGCWQLTLSGDPNAAIAALIDAFGRAGQ
jgi:hypothetical protein